MINDILLYVLNSVLHLHMIILREMDGENILHIARQREDICDLIETRNF
jgi:hypothetical protein